MSVAQERSWAAGAAGAGLHVKIFRRLGVSETPVTLTGPAIASSCRCGAMVTP